MRCVIKEGKYPVLRHIAKKEVFLAFREGYDRIFHNLVTHHIEKGEILLIMGEEGAHKKNNLGTHRLDEDDVFARMLH